MVIGVIVFSEYISAFTTEREDDNSLDHKLVKVKNNTEFLRKKYSLNARSSLNLDKVVNMSKNFKLLDE